MRRWYGRREGRRRPRLIGWLIWLIAIVVVLIVISLLFGGFTKSTTGTTGTKGTMVSLGYSRVPPAAAQHASLPPR